MAEMPKITMYTDGACPIDGPRTKCGGWANIVLWNGEETVRIGREYPSTNNRMELTALIDGLQSLVVPCEVVFYCDSKYVVNGTNQWLNTWIRKGWRKGSVGGGKIINQDLWEKVAASKKIHKVHGIWVAGHTGPYFVGRTIHHDYNDRCDQMAVQQSLRMSMEK